jgi:cysteine synthase A
VWCNRRLFDVLRVDLIDEIITMTDEQAYALGRKLAQEEGILSGISTGAALYAALQVAQRADHQGQLIVAIQPSGGERYLSTRMWEAPDADSVPKSEGLL